MSVFKVYVDGEIFFHPSISSLAITQAEVTEDASSIDSLKLSAPRTHPYIDKIKPISSLITLKKDDRVVFQGRALDDGTDFYNTHTWTCESCLAWLKDTYQPPFDYEGPLKTMLQTFLDEHNKNVEDKKKFALGNVTVQDDNDYVHYASESYINTMDAIKKKLIETHGGYLVYRIEDGVNYLDYLADFSEATAQTVEYGKNLLDVTITRDHSSRISALIPYGATIEKASTVGEADTKLDITSVNSGSNYVYDQGAVDEIGWIWGTQTWDQVTVAANLLTKAKARLAELKDGVTSIELSIVDESDAGVDISDIHAREYIHCISDPHGIDGNYLILSKTTDFLNPSQNKVTVGSTVSTLSKITAGNYKQGPKGDAGPAGRDGTDSLLIRIASSAGTMFHNTAIATTLTASVFHGTDQITGDSLTALGTLCWYLNGATDAAAAGDTYTIAAGTAGETAAVLCKLADGDDVKAQEEITLSIVKDIKNYVRYYCSVATGDKAPDQPTVDPPGDTWTDTEASYDGTTTDLYYTDLTEYSDGSFSFSPVSKSGSMDAVHDLSQTLAGNASDIAALQDTVRETSDKIDTKADEIKTYVDSTYVSTDDLEQVRGDLQTSITETESSIRYDFQQTTDTIDGKIDDNQSKLEEYIRFNEGTIELGKVGNSFTTILSNEELAFMQDGASVAFISDNSMKITDAEIDRKLSLGESSAGWFDFVPRSSGNLSVKWRGSS